MRTSEIISEGRSLLFERGWTQAGRDDDPDAMCILIAMSAVIRTNGLGARCDVLPLLQEATGSAYIPDWNDAPGRTFSEVIDMLNRAEKLAESREAA